MVIDIHCHILPGVDDGAKNPSVTRNMLKTAFREGIDAIVATPHFECGMDIEHLERRNNAYFAVRKWAKAINPDTELFLGNEIFYSEGVVAALEQGLALTMNGTKYVLVEFPVYAEFPYIKKAVQNLMYAGYLPVIAHLERYEGLKKREHVQELVGMGTCMQVNVSAVMGKEGWNIRRYVLSLMRSGYVHVLATDAHGCEHRHPEMRDCLLYIDKKVGKDYREKISSTNPIKIIRGEYISE